MSAEVGRLREVLGDREAEIQSLTHDCDHLLKQNDELRAINADLLAGCKFFMAMLEDGRLVRDVRKDGEPDWSLRMMNFVRDLQKVQIAVLKAEAA